MCEMSRLGSTNSIWAIDDTHSACDAIVYAIIMLAITYWPITLTIIGLIILRCKWGWVKSKQAERRKKREQQKIMDAIKAGEEKVKRQKAERERKWWEDFWKNYDNLFIQKIALPDKTREAL